jgi:hypothetical protein
VVGPERAELLTFWFVERRYAVRRCSQRSVLYDLSDCTCPFLSDCTPIFVPVAVTVAVNVHVEIAGLTPRNSGLPCLSPATVDVFRRSQF